MIIYPFDPYCGPALAIAADELARWEGFDYVPTADAIARAIMEPSAWTFDDDVPSEIVSATLAAWKRAAERVLADAGMRPTDEAAC